MTRCEGCGTPLPQPKLTRAQVLRRLKALGKRQAHLEGELEACLLEQHQLQELLARLDNSGST